MRLVQRQSPAIHYNFSISVPMGVPYEQNTRLTANNLVFVTCVHLMTKYTCVAAVERWTSFSDVELTWIIFYGIVGFQVIQLTLMTVASYQAEAFTFAVAQTARFAVFDRCHTLDWRNTRLTIWCCSPALDLYERVLAWIYIDKPLDHFHSTLNEKLNTVHSQT